MPIHVFRKEENKRNKENKDRNQLNMNNSKGVQEIWNNSNKFELSNKEKKLLRKEHVTQKE